MSEIKTTHKGACLCEHVRYEILGDFESFYLCHCTYCQKDTGSAHAANLFSETAQLNWINGKENVKTYTLPSTRHVKSFCSQCGSALPTVLGGGHALLVPAGSLDSAVLIKPNAHLFISSKANWEEELEAVQKFEGFPV